MTVYDKAGRPVESWDGVGTPLKRREAAWTYNRNGQKTSLTDARGFRAEMTYDGFDRQQRWIFPSKSTPGVADSPSPTNAGDYEQYLYDPNGNRTALRKRDGSVLAFRFDSLNRMTVKIVPERAGLDWFHSRDVYYGYDLRGLQTEARFDRLSGEGISNVYDGFGRLVSTTTALEGFSRTVSHLYDREGRETELTFPDGAKFWTGRDGLGRQTEAWQGPLGSTATGMAGFHYDGASQLHRIGRRWGSGTNFDYDGAKRVSRLEHGFNDAASSTVSTFAYNPASQLKSETRSNDAYAWAGSVATNRSYATNGQNQYTSAGAARFDYDPNGNLISTVNAPWSTTYTYDIENRLVAASGTHNVALRYDPLGRLYQTWSPDSGATTRFLYDGDELIAEYDHAGTLQRRYIHGDSDDDPIYWYEGPGLDQPRFPHADRQGSIIATAGPGGTALWKNTYDEYGIPGAGNRGRFQYTGQAWIADLGLYYYKARFYSPYLGRFLQVDPIGYEDQFNLYAYVRNDPLNGLDPTGMNCADAVNQGLGGKCYDSANYNQQKDGNSLTWIGTAQTDSAVIAQGGSFEATGEKENGFRVDVGEKGGTLKAAGRNGGDGSTATVSFEKAELKGAKAFGHAHLNRVEAQSSSVEGAKRSHGADGANPGPGDGLAVIGAQLPNYVLHNGVKSVVEVSNGQARIRVIEGEFTPTEARKSREFLRTFQNELRRR